MKRRRGTQPTDTVSEAATVWHITQTAPDWCRRATIRCGRAAFTPKAEARNTLNDPHWTV